MLNQLGFRWNEEFKSVQMEREIFDFWVRSHPNAKGLWNKPFPHYDELSSVCGKDRATGHYGEPPVVMASNLFREMEDDIRLGSQEYPTPDNEQTQLPEDAIEEDQRDMSMRRASIPNISTDSPNISAKTSRGSERKLLTFQNEMIEIMQSTADIQSTHMGILVAWQSEKYMMEFGCQKEVVQVIFGIEGPTEDDRCDLIDIICTDIQKQTSF
ncbi:uncharacterized protein LOC120073288 [Benincasa hispida]|uniref:uncharacterized protein LOC120073288 n=1 Tax=Benincasa hispida TaxID=102211 RepID=UPI0019008CF4|nr:uncharacterized protein LOC120073288 [Benincasa hispida]